MTHHKFVNNDTDGKEIRGKSIRHFTQYFRSHISRSPTRLKLKRKIARTMNFGDSKISQPSISSLFKHNILGLDIAMNDAFFMYILKPNNETRDDKLCYNIKHTDFCFCELFLVANVISEICSSQVIHRQIQVKLILEWAVNVYQEWVVQGG